MNSSAITLMLLTQVTVTCVTIYFFIKVLRSPARKEPDSYSDNDPAG